MTIASRTHRTIPGKWPRQGDWGVFGGAENALLQGAYDFEGLDSPEKVRRLLEIAALDTLSLENSVARSRTLANLAIAALRLLEVEGLEERLESLESAVNPRLLNPGQ